MKTDLSFKINNASFMHRTAGITLRENKVLLVTEEHLDAWYTPGGRVSLFEFSKDAIIREIIEELGTKPIVKNLLWVSEHMFHSKEYKLDTHGLVFYYLIEFPKDSEIYNKSSWSVDVEEFEDGKHSISKHIFQWFKIDELHTVNLVPKFLPEYLQNLTENTRHIVLNELI